MSAEEMCFPTGMQQNWSKELKYLSSITPASLRNNCTDLVHEFIEVTAKYDIFVSKSFENTCFIKAISTEIPLEWEHLEEQFLVLLKKTV